jgi:quercetin dioxygenase-like cupin family protein
VSYFERSEGADPEQGGSARFVRTQQDVPEIEVVPGVWMRPVFGDRLNLSLVRMEPGAVAAVHEHSEEQIGIVLEGTCSLELADQTRILGTGDVYVAPSFVSHGATAGDEGCRILDAFSPPREALRELLERTLRSRDTTT